MESFKNICTRKRAWLVGCFFVLFVAFDLNAQLVINEVIARNGGLYYDESLDCSAIIEVYNTSNDPVQLEDYYLSTNRNDLKKWRFPNDLVFPNQRAIVYLSNKDIVSPMHANFSLAIHENIYLSIKNGTLAELVDSLPTIQYPYNASIARFPDGIGNFVFAPSSINSTNLIGDLTLPNSSVLSINSGVFTVGTPFNVSNSNSKTSFSGLETTYDGVTGTSFVVPDPSVNPLRFSIIPSNPGLNYPVEDYTESRANDRGWLPPTPNQPKVVIIRNQYTSPNGVKSDEQIRTIFTSTPNFKLPIISLITDSVGFFDNPTGVSVYGDYFDGNYNFRGRFSERLVHMQIFDSLGNLQYETSAGLRIKGNGSRHSTMKSMRFIQRSIYPQTNPDDSTFLINYSLLRAAGHRPECFGRDYLAHLFVEKLSFVKAAPKYHATFLNGEFWGIYDLRQNLDEKYFEFYFKLPEKTTAIADHTYTIKTESRINVTDFSELTLFAENNDLNIPSNYSYVQNKLDFTDFIQVNCAEIFLGNADYPRTNNAWFNVQNEDVYSKWKNLFFDLDASFGGDCDTVLRSFNTLNYFLQTTTGNWVKSTRLLRNLLNNPQFVRQFSSTMADLLNSSFKTEVLLEKYTQYQNEIVPNQLLQVERWGYPSTSETLIDRYSEIPSLNKWNQLSIAIEDYFSSRQKYIYRHFMNRFLFEDTARIEVDIDLLNSGFIQINSLLLSNELEGFNNYPWNGLYFKGVPVNLTAFAKRGYRFNSWSNGEISAQISIDLSQDSLITADFEIDPSYKEVHINEILVHNTWGEVDQYAQRNGWIELYNPNSFPISLDGYFLSDDLSNLSKFALKAFKEHTIQANDYALFYASNVVTRGLDHCNFNLQDNSTIYLVAPDGATIIQQITIPALSNNYSYGSLPNGSQTYVEFSNPTPRINNGESSIHENKHQTFTIHPNPTHSIVHISSVGNYQLVMLNGFIIQEIHQSNIFDMTNFPAGIYFIKNENGEFHRLVKM